MEETAGFVNGSINRRKIMEILDSKGATDSKRIAKIARLIPSATDKIIEELETADLIQKTNDGKIELTESGKIVIKYVRAL
ncbi:MAG: transcriptional regulator [Methanimicrococcus sp.]|nr:transcriptional regulator [Methanimicrococcus sp.]